MAVPADTRVRVVFPAASDEEAAAIAAALSRLVADHAPAPAEAVVAQEPVWLRTARLEAVDRAPLATGWGLGISHKIHRT